MTLYALHTTHKFKYLKHCSRFKACSWYQSLPHT